MRPLLAPRIERFLERSTEGPNGRSVLGARAFEATLRGDPRDDVTALAEEALDDVALRAEETADAGVGSCLLGVLILCDRFAAARRHPRRRPGRRGRARLAARARPGSPSPCPCHVVRGDCDDEARAGLDALCGRGDLVEPALAGSLVEARLDRGDPEAARAVDGPPATGSTVFRDALALSLARLRMARGDVAGGLDDLLRTGRRLDAWGAANPSLAAWRSTAGALLVRRGEPRRGRELVEEELVRAWRFGAPRALGIALGAAGRVQEGPGAPARAVDCLEGSGADLELARALAALGTALRRADRPAQARDPLRRALDGADCCGAAALAERAHRQLMEAGERPRRRALTGAGALTPSERRIARLAAGGNTNRVIAETLVVTTKTVEAHLSSTFRKLDVSGREELEGRL
jgi:DNA-binding CsgD family transcriptional regulator